MDPRNPCDSTQGFSPNRTRGNWLHEHDKMKLSVLEHQTWWERSSKRKKRSKQKRHDKTKLSVLEHQTWWERSSKRKKRSKHNDTTKQSSAYSNIKRGGRGAQKERNARNKNDTTKQSSAYSNIKRGGRGAQKERNARNTTTRQNKAQQTRTSNVVGEELKRKETLETKKHDKTKRRRCPEERKIKRLNHHGQMASTYGSLLRPERN